MASTGFNFDAKYAGIIPATSPIPTDTNNPVKILPAVSTRSNSSPYFTPKTIKKTSNSPIIPPNNDNLIKKVFGTKRLLYSYELGSFPHRNKHNIGNSKTSHKKR